MRRDTADVAASTDMRFTKRMLRTTSIVFAALMLAAMLVTVLGPERAQAEGWAEIDTDVLNLRSEPGTWAEVLDLMWQGDGVDILDGPTEDGWYYVSYDGTEGWAYGGYLALEGASSSGGGYEAEQWIDVDRGDGTVSLMVGDETVNSFNASFGYDESDDGFFATAIGTYYVYEKNADLTWTDWGQAFIEDWVAYDPERSNGFHSWSMDEWGNVLPGGDGLTGGCVSLEPWASSTLYAFAYEGMRVEVHW